MNKNQPIIQQSLSQCGPGTQNLSIQLLTPAQVWSGSPLSITQQLEEVSQLLNTTLFNLSVPKQYAGPPKTYLAFIPVDHPCEESF